METVEKDIKHFLYMAAYLAMFSTSTNQNIKRTKSSLV